MRILRLAVAVTLMLLGPVTSHAQVENITRGELALTPDFCQDVQTINGWSQHFRESPRSPYWVSKMGKTFWAMHHYCWALIRMHRANAAGLKPSTRDHMIRKSIADFHYVVNNATREFVLLPEIFFRIGEAHVLLREPVQAIESYEASRSLKPDYWPAYVGHARVLERLGKKVDALKVIEEGLRHSPGEPTLTAQFVRLGGQPSNLVSANTASGAPPRAATASSAPQ